MVKCEICGHSCKSSIAQHLKNSHNMTSAEYLELYPNASVTSEEFKKMMLERNRSDSMKEIRIARNKSDKMRKLISDRNRDPAFINKCKEGLNKPEVKEAMSRRMSERNAENWKNEEYRSRMTETIRQNKLKFSRQPDQVAKFRLIMQRNWRDPVISAKMIIAPKSRHYGISSVYKSDMFNKEFRLKSQGEAKFVEVMEDLNVENLEYESVRIPMDSGRTYIPDFKVCHNGVIYIVEIKYNEGPDEYLDKVKSALDFCEFNGFKFCWVTRFDGINKIIKNKSLECTVLCRG